MKQYKWMCWMIGVGLLLSACTDELEKKATDVKEGVPVVVKLAFIPDEPIKIETKAGEVTTHVKNLYALIFDSEGIRLPGEYGGGLVSVNQNSTSVHLSTTSGKRYIYGVANLTTSTLEIEKAELDQIKSVDALKRLSLTLKEKGIHESTGQFLMSGFCTGKADTHLEEAPLCSISLDGTITAGGTETLVLKLKRIQSRIKFEVTTGGRAKSFVLTSYSVLHIPTECPLYEDWTQQAITTSSEWFNVENNKTLDGGSKSFSFYMLENKQQKRMDFPVVETKDANKYRADATYAPEKGTCIVLRGAYEGTEDKYEGGKVVVGNQPVQASVVYYIYLGYVNKVLDDYNSLRNKDYTYHIIVNGINSVIVEAELKEDNSSVGGDVYYESGGAIISVDAHYASKVLKFKKSELAKDEAADNIMIKVSSHKTVGFESADTEWLTFCEGGSIDGETEKPVRYPGKEKAITAEAFIERLKQIALNKNIADSDEFYFTCFINENYPIKELDTESAWTQFVNTNSDRMAQIICRARSHNDSQTIDAAYLIRQKPIYTFFRSGDQPWGIESMNETTEFENGIEIGLSYGSPYLNQFGQDFYNGRANMIYELGNSPESRRWYKESFNPQQTPKYAPYVDSFNKAYAACMQRNRDEDGNGQISDDEIKWYLPAIFQYTDMSIGANALPKTVQLYSDADYLASAPVNGRKSWRFKHYISNSGTKIYWGEEGGPYGEDSGDSGWDAAWTKSWKRQIRCVRNLGPNSLNKEMAPSPIARKNGNEMALSLMSLDALRSNRVEHAELLAHTEREEASLPYQGSFLVAKNVCSSGSSLDYGWSTVNIGIDKTGKSPCSTYRESGDGSDVGTWRLPNMRELLILVSHGGYKDRTMSRTYYSFYLDDILKHGKIQKSNGELDGYTIYSPMDGKSREGFAYGGSVVYLISPGNDAFRIRCVKDK